MLPSKHTLHLKSVFLLSFKTNARGQRVWDHRIIECLGLGGTLKPTPMAGGCNPVNQVARAPPSLALNASTDKMCLYTAFLCSGGQSLHTFIACPARDVAPALQEVHPQRTEDVTSLGSRCQTCPGAKPVPPCGHLHVEAQCQKTLSTEQTMKATMCPALLAKY